MDYSKDFFKLIKYLQIKMDVPAYPTVYQKIVDFFLDLNAECNVTNREELDNYLDANTFIGILLHNMDNIFEELMEWFITFFEQQENYEMCSVLHFILLRYNKYDEELRDAIESNLGWIDLE